MSSCGGDCTSLVTVDIKKRYDSPCPPLEVRQHPLGATSTNGDADVGAPVGDDVVGVSVGDCVGDDVVGVLVAACVGDDVVGVSNKKT